jgi:hypothetical protein
MFSASQMINLIRETSVGLLKQRNTRSTPARVIQPGCVRIRAKSLVASDNLARAGLGHPKDMFGLEVKPTSLA